MTLHSPTESGPDQLLKSMLVREPAKPPVDIEAIARSLGVEIVFQKMLCEGFLEEIGANNYVIKVNQKSSITRQRFTIAHEIAHIILKRVNRSQIRSIFRAHSPEEERFIRNWSNDEEVCNLISAALLIPLRTAKQLSDWKSLSIEKIEKTSREWKISKDVLLWRVLTLAPYVGGFLWCKTASKLDDPTRIDLSLWWGKFPKSRKIRIRKGDETSLLTRTHSIVDFKGNEERFDKIMFDFEGFRGLRAVRVKAYGKGDEKRVLVVVYPREIKPELLPIEKSLRQTLLPTK